MYQDEIQSSPCSTFFTTLETLPCGCDVAECKDEKLFNCKILYNVTLPSVIYIIQLENILKVLAFIKEL